MPNEQIEIASWTEYRMLLIATLERLEKTIKEIEIKIDLFRKDGLADIGAVRSELSELKVEFAMQKVKIGLIGSVAGAAVSALISYLMKGH